MEFLSAKLVGFMLVMTRVSAFFIFAPVLSWSMVPVRIKTGVILLLSIFFWTIRPSALGGVSLSPIEVLIMMFNEAAYGLAIAIIMTLLFSAVKVCGGIIEQQIGFSMSELFDPITGESAEPIGMLLEILFVMIFLASDGHHMLMMALNKSFISFPTGQLPTPDILLNGVVEAGSTVLIAGLRLAAPMLAAFLLLLAVLAVFSRVLPDMNILFISLPMRVFLGLIMIGIFMPLFGSYIKEFSDWMAKLLPL